MSKVKPSFEFIRRVIDGGLRQFKAPEPLATDVMCDELRIEFHSLRTTVKFFQNGLEIGETEIAGNIQPGETLTLSDIKLYWPIELR